MNKDKMKNFLRKLFPLFYAESLIDFIRIDELFPDLRKPGTVCRMIFLLIGSFLIFLCGFELDLLVKYQPLIRGSIGETGRRILTAFSITFVEVVIIRVWLISIDGGRGNIEKIQFFQVLQEMQDDEKQKWLKRSRITALSLYIASLIVNQPLSFYQLIFLDLEWDDRLIRVAWIISGIAITRLTVPDLPILYSFIIASMILIENKAEDFLLLLSKLDSRDGSKHKISPITASYEDLVQTVRRLNSFSNFIVSVGKGLAIPLFSSYIWLYLTPVSGTFHYLMRNAATILGFMYCIRIYLLIGHLSRMTPICNQIYFLSASKAAREQSRERLYIVRKLNLIMQDVSVERSQLLLDEFAGKITPFDVVDSIVSTFSFLMLFASLEDSIWQM